MAGAGRAPVSRPLERLRVLDLTDGAFAYAPRLLAGLGASVLRIEPPGGSTVARTPALSVTFGADRELRTIDFDEAGGREEFASLVAGADVVCETFRPGRLHELSLDYEDLSPASSQVVWVSITPFGRTGPRRDWRSSNLIAWAVAGVLPAVGDPDRAPLVPGGPIPLAELLASLQAAVGALTAIRARRRTGRGQLVDVSVHACAVAASSETGVPAFLDDMIVRRRTGNRRRQLAPSGLYRCRDGYAAVIIVPVAHWDALARWVHEKTANEAILDPMFRDIQTRYETAEMLEEWVEALTELYGKQELFEEGQRRGISITPVNTLSDMPRDPHLAARRWWRDVHDPTLGAVRIAGPPYRIRSG
jgi:crotonobetainyl-CoA:carnitine CoA-transferase CaiB-like acyl-CoA transferase